MFYRFKKALTVILALALCATVFTACGKTNGTKTAVTVNDEAVSAGTVSTYVKYQQAQNYYFMSMYGAAAEGQPYWDSDYEEGTTYGQYFLDQTMEQLEKMVLIRQHAGEYGYSLSEEDNKAISEAAAQFISDNGTVGEWIGADQASLENLLSLYNYQTKTRDLFIADVDREVSDEEAAQSNVLYAFISTESAPDDYEGTDEEYAEEAKKLMEQMLETSKTADLEQIEAEAHAEEEDAEAEEDTDADAEPTLSDIVSDEVHAYTHVASEISENITVSSTLIGAEDAGSLSEEAAQAARALKDGEFSDVIESEKGYYIVKMEAVFDADATENEKASIISERENTAYNDLIQSWYDSANIVLGDGMKQIKVTDKESYVVATN